MPGLNPDAVRSASSYRGFRLLMWGLLFFVPIPLPRIQVMPDVLGWLLLFAGLQQASGLHPRLGGLRAAVVLGLLLWAGRLASALLGFPGAETAKSVLYMVTWLVLFGVTWHIGAVLMELARQRESAALAADAGWRRWLALAPPLLFGLAALVPPRLEVPALAIVLLVAACVLSLLMGLMASASRACRQAARTGT